MRTLRIFISTLLLTSCLLGTVAADTTPFRIGVFPRLNQDKTLRQFQPLAEWLGRHLGREVVLESAPDFAAFWERVKAERYALIHYNQYHYIRAHREFGHRVILKNEELGRSQIRATFAGACRQPHPEYRSTAWDEDPVRRRQRGHGDPHPGT